MGPSDWWVEKAACSTALNDWLLHTILEIVFTTAQITGMLKCFFIIIIIMVIMVWFLLSIIVTI